MTERHAGKVAVVTGAASGIGQAFAERLGREGATVVLVDREDAKDVAADIGRPGAIALAIRCDVSNPEDVALMAKKVLADCGRCDILINNAAIQPVQPFEKITFEDWRRVMAVNLDAHFLTAQAFLPGMRARHWGRIINMASDVIALVLTGFAHYTASKGGVIGLTRAIASEYGNHGITANAIAPGLTRTPGTMNRKEAPLGGPSQDPFELTMAHQAIKHSLVPEDHCGMMSFLASDDAALITGQTFYLDAGQIRS